MKKLLLLLLLLPNLVLASKETSGTVTLSGANNIILVDFSKPNSSCGSRYYLPLSSEYEKALFSMLLAAQLSGKKVWANGAGDCQTGYPYRNAYKLVNMKIYD
ncbi:hypothetical protein CWC22_010220 [Pseudoalteromonas rubra]|uniref:Uncharacterized protein n=1 Tax=Pseudoalteromonas rubra TaxID=43658 RepID=A0A5S3V5K7_9GAMM|nr:MULTISPECIES: hypothetical protein [Pseudoalteromonas]MEC4089159.1 hypothetical protein [Pseudoalteromonas rubra]QPB83345.1 hypothetical protein CWC22_010220 [Pseudoalteromonas rubra]